MTEQPQRIQRRRTAGWRMPAGAMYVGRPSLGGNPFRIGVPYCGPTIRQPNTAVEAVAAFDDWIARDTLNPLMWDRALILAHVRLKTALGRGALRGKSLVCWCPLNQPCHADVLLRIANQVEE